MKRLSWWRLATTALLLATACSAVPEIRYFDLTQSATSSAVNGDVEDPKISAAPSKSPHWAVAELAVDPPYDQDRLVYRQTATSSEVGFYEFTRWAAPLGQILQRELVRRLDEPQDFAYVEAMEMGHLYHRVLRGRVLQAEEVDQGDGSITARLRLDLELEDGDGGLCWRGEIAGQASGHAKDGAEVMALFQRAADHLLGEVERQLTAPSLLQEAPGCP